MVGVDALPVISQLKSLVQVISGDAEGARETQENFSKRCPVVSQVRSAVHAIGGNEEEAREVQLEFVDEMSNMVDGIPVVGHIKGGIHYAVGDREGGDKAMKSASRTAGVIGGSVGGFFVGGLVGGPVGAIVGGVSGGITAGAAMDGITTGVDSAVHHKFKPSGYVAAVDNIIKNPSPGNIFDAVMIPVGDGLTGYSAAKITGIIKTKVTASSSGIGGGNVAANSSGSTTTVGESSGVAGSITTVGESSGVTGSITTVGESSGVAGSTTTVGESSGVAGSTATVGASGAAAGESTFNKLLAPAVVIAVIKNFTKMIPEIIKLIINARNDVNRCSNDPGAATSSNGTAGNSGTALDSATRAEIQEKFELIKLKVQLFQAAVNIAEDLKKFQEAQEELKFLEQDLKNARNPKVLKILEDLQEAMERL